MKIIRLTSKPDSILSEILIMVQPTLYCYKIVEIDMEPMNEDESFMTTMRD